MARSNSPTKRSASITVVVDTESSSRKNKTRADFLFITGPKEHISNHKVLNKIINKSGLKNIACGNGIQNLDIGALKNEIQRRLNPNGHALLTGHGGVYEEQHYFMTGDLMIAAPTSVTSLALPTREILQLSKNNILKSPQKTGVTWHIFSCHARNLHKEIKPASSEWKRGYVFIYSSSKPVITESVSESLKAMMHYLADCKTRMVEADPLSIFIHLTKTQGDCVTLLGGDLHAPLVSHSPKTPIDQTESRRQSRIKGDERDLNSLQNRKEEMGAESEQNHLEKSRQLRSMLFARIDRNDIDAVRKILDTDPDLISSRSNSDGTLLLESCDLGYKEMATLLLERGIDINDTDEDKNTPLAMAVTGENADIVSMLLENGADIASKNSFGNNALIKAVATRNKEMIKLLLDKGADKTVNNANTEGTTALMLAAENGMASTVQLLLKAGANPSIKNKEGMTALHLANRNDFPATAELLMQFHKQQNLPGTVKELQISPFNS